MNLIIVQANANFKNVLENRFNRSEKFNVVGVTDNGETAIDLIARKKPDMVLLDIVLPKLDGLGVIDKIKEMHLKVDPIIVVISRIDSENIIQATLKRGASYYFVRPINLSLLENRLIEIYDVERSTRSGKKYLEKTMQYIRVNEEDTIYNREAIITNFMHELGISAHLSGYKFLIQAIMLATQDKSRLNAITKCIYPVVAKHNKTTTQRVERAMRNAISNAWSKKHHSLLMNNVFENEIFENRRPTNSEFIAVAADKVKFENDYINWQENPNK